MKEDGELSDTMKQENKKNKREYYKSVDRAKERSVITLATALVYFTAISNLIVTTSFSGEISLDAIFLICIGFGIHMKQSRICAGILMGYAVINAIVTVSLSAGLLVFAGLCALKGTMDFAIEWKLYCDKWDREQIR